MSESKKKILVVCDYYLPGFKSGGGMRTIVNMVDRLSDRYDFSVITRDHDGRLDKSPYKTVKIGDWNQIGNARVFYLVKNDIKAATIKRLVDEAAPEAIYLNSFFATPANYLLFLRWRGQVKAPVIMAPCGELITAAMQFKTAKKRLHITLAKLTGLHKGLFWKATTDLEKEDIEKELGKKERMFVAADMPPKTIFPEYERSIKPKKTGGELKLVFLARFVRTKNFGFLLDVLEKVPGKISVDVIGDLEDKAYWEECLEKIKKLPPNITVNYAGAIDNRLVPKKLAEYHFLVSPSLNENFGHIFPEALSAGCPLIISDRTPWLDLKEKGIGWDLPLENPKAWRETLKHCVEMDDGAYRQMSDAAREYAVDWLSRETLEKDTVAVLEAALNTV
ncbi:MAG TPA: glycosyltransferase family 4 protein [Pyrinomonadaceae bacterium]|jgi:glycosyltransferase involved in cell wall biosynthesis|nr:glycosyltransferase family 4 protein [Pyrinomonadaceae bacterium]